MVTSKPKRISVAAGLVHMFNFLYGLLLNAAVTHHPNERITFKRIVVEGTPLSQSEIWNLYYGFS
jgi:hypothetical protein